VAHRARTCSRRCVHGPVVIHHAPLAEVRLRRIDDRVGLQPSRQFGEDVWGRYQGEAHQNNHNNGYPYRPHRQPRRQTQPPLPSPPIASPAPCSQPPLMKIPLRRFGMFVDAVHRDQEPGGLGHLGSAERPLCSGDSRTNEDSFWPIGDGQPVQELSWLTAHGRAASVDTHGSHCFCRMPPEFRLPSSEGEDKTRRLKASRNRNAISSIVL